MSKIIAYQHKEYIRQMQQLEQLNNRLAELYTGKLELIRQSKKFVFDITIEIHQRKIVKYRQRANYWKRKVSSLML